MKNKTRALIYLAFAIALFSGALLVSRLADFGVVPAERFGAGDWKRGDVMLAIEVQSADGIHHPLGKAPRLAPGDRLTISYGKTRYTYLWVLRVHPDKRIEPLIPAKGTPTELGKYGRSTENAGETIETMITVPDEAGPFVLLGMFTAIPRRIDELQEAADKIESDDAETIARELYIPSRRFVHIIEIVR